MNTTQIQALDRAHTVVLIPDGIMEEHGPYMPSFTDGYLDEAVTQDLAHRIAARKGWAAVIFPTVPLGTSPANVIGHKFSFPGSFTVRASTVRDVFMDLADSLGQLGFQHIFIIDSHGGPPQSVALDTASDYFHDTYGGHMTHLLGKMRIFNCCHALDEVLTKEQVATNGLSVHADALEQSIVLALQPKQVPQAYRHAAGNGAADFAGLTAVAEKPGWPGYLGSPAYASASLGARYVQELNEAVAMLALDILDGKTDPQKLDRYGATMMEMTKSIEAPMLADQDAAAARQRRWLRAHPQTMDPATQAVQ